MKALSFKLWFLVFLVFLTVTASGCDGTLRIIGREKRKAVDELVPEAVRVVREGLTDEDPRVRVNAVEVVSAAGRIELMPKVQRLLRDEFVPVRFAAALAVGDTRYRLGKSAVEQLLKDQDDVRIAAAYAMAKLGSAESFEIVRKAIASKDQMIRANAALLLGKNGDKSDLKLLYWALKDENSGDKVRFQVAEAIAMLGDEQIYQKLWTMLISAYADDRIMGIRAMGALGTEDAQDSLITMLDDDILEIRLAAAEQLGMLGQTIGEPEVISVFEKNLTAGLDGEGRERISVLTALAIGRIGTPALAKFLPQLLEDESEFVRIAAARAVFECEKWK